MVAVVRETERKYQASAGAESASPDLSTVRGVASVRDEGVLSLDALYYDTADRRLATDGITLRRRTGGKDPGWHLKLPVARGVRDEVQAPPQDELPRALAGLIRSRVRDRAVEPLMRLRSERHVRRLLDAEGEPLAEVAVDRVAAERQPNAERAEWTEVEVELAQGRDTDVLDAIERQLTAAGLRPASAASKLEHALAETSTEERKKKPEKPKKPEESKESKESKKSAKSAKKAQQKTAPPQTAGDAVLDYVRAQARALVELDPAVRRELPDSVHRMRVATRRLRSCFRSYGKVLDRTATGPLGTELRWLAAELGVDRDREVLLARLLGHLDELPRELRVGPIRGRLRTFDRARRAGSRRQLIAVLDSRRYLNLLDALDALLADPPLRPAAHRPPKAVLAKAVRRDFDRLAARIGEVLATAEPGPDRDLAMHTARKTAKRTRYAAEAARGVFGKAAKQYAGRMTRVQELLGEHQDSVVAREALREIAAQAQDAGEPSFTYGVLYEREVRRAARCEADLPELWRDVALRDHRELR